MWWEGGLLLASREAPALASVDPRTGEIRTLRESGDVLHLWAGPNTTNAWAIGLDATHQPFAETVGDGGQRIALPFLPDIGIVLEDRNPSFRAILVRGAELVLVSRHDRSLKARPLAILGSAPAALRTIRWQERTWLYAACPTSHTVEYLCVESGEGPFQIGAGLAPRDLALLPANSGPPMIWVLNTFSNDLLRIGGT